MQDFYIILAERIEPHPDGSASAFCDELGLATYGSSEKDAGKRPWTAIHAVLRDADGRGALGHLLDEKKIRPYPMLNAKKSRAAFEKQEIDIDHVSHRPVSMSGLVGVGK